MEDNNNSILDNAMLENYEEHITRQREIKIKEVTSQKTLKIYHQQLMLKPLSNLKQSK